MIIRVALALSAIIVAVALMVISNGSVPPTAQPSPVAPTVMTYDTLQTPPLMNGFAVFVCLKETMRCTPVNIADSEHPGGVQLAFSSLNECENDARMRTVHTRALLRAENDPEGIDYRCKATESLPGAVPVQPVALSGRARSEDKSYGVFLCTEGVAGCVLLERTLMSRSDCELDLQRRGQKPGVVYFVHSARNPGIDYAPGVAEKEGYHQMWACLEHRAEWR